MDRLDRIELMIERLVVSQERIDAQQAKTDQEIDKLVASQAKMDQEIDKLVTSQAKTYAQPALTDAKLDKLARMYGGLEDSQETVAEEFYYNSLCANPELNGIRFDFVDKSITRSRQGVVDDFDIVMVNDEDVFVIEVKHEAHEQDLERLLKKKVVNFHKLFPMYSQYRHHFGLATFYIHDQLKDQALSSGVTVLQRKGDVIETAAKAGSNLLF